MLRLTVHLFLLLLCYFALFDGIEARKSSAVEGNSLGWEPLAETLIFNVNNIGWDPLERCEIELIEPSGRTTRFE